MKTTLSLCYNSVDSIFKQQNQGKGKKEKKKNFHIKPPKWQRKPNKKTKRLVNYEMWGGDQFFFSFALSFFLVGSLLSMYSFLFLKPH